MNRIPGLYITTTENKGRGIFTAFDIQAGSVIEICPVIIIPESEVEIIHKTTLHDYYFRWGTDQNQAAIALGFGSIYNHSNSPNAKVILDYEAQNIIIESISDISSGVEICYNYIDDELSADKLWFDVK